MSSNGGKKPFPLVLLLLLLLLLLLVILCSVDVCTNMELLLLPPAAQRSQVHPKQHPLKAGLLPCSGPRAAENHLG
jgi:hypothetical protein